MKSAPRFQKNSVDWNAILAALFVGVVVLGLAGYMWYWYMVGAAAERSIELYIQTNNAVQRYYALKKIAPPATLSPTSTRTK